MAAPGGEGAGGTAFVFSGGGSLGAVEVGMLLALGEHGVAPELVVGTSVGAINAAWVAARPGLDGARELADVWRSVRRPDVFPLRPIVGLRGLVGRSDHLVSSDRLRRLLRRHLSHERLEDSLIPLRVVATDVITGLEVVLDRGDTVEALLASTAIPGVFPPVTIAGQHLVDGGVADNTPIAYAVEAGASVVFVLPTGYACTRERPPPSALGMALHAITRLVQQRLQTDVERYKDRVDLRVVPPLCPLDVSPVDFSHTAELMERARRSTQRWLAAGDESLDPAELLSFHSH
jgi:NTE family protein